MIIEREMRRLRLRLANGRRLNLTPQEEITLRSELGRLQHGRALILADLGTDSERHAIENRVAADSLIMGGYSPTPLA